MQYQDRNIHGRVFGGHLMRIAYQIAWVSAYKLIGGVGTNPSAMAADAALAAAAAAKGGAGAVALSAGAGGGGSGVQADAGRYLPLPVWVDEIQFLHAVNIGDLASFEAHIVASDPDPSAPIQVLVHVACYVEDVRAHSRKTTNDFYFGFAGRSTVQDPIPFVMPQRYEGNAALCVTLVTSSRLGLLLTSSLLCCAC
jgi:acyl-CoA hydrolase